MSVTASPWGRGWLLVPFVPLLSLCTVPAPARATPIDRPAWVDQAAAAALILEGTVTDQWYEDSPIDSSFALTLVRVDVATHWKGRVESGAIAVVLPGGLRSDGAWLTVPGVPRVEVGDAVLIHAYVIDDQHVGLVNWSTALVRMPLTDAGEVALVDGQGWVVDHLDGVDVPTYTGSLTETEVDPRVEASCAAGPEVSALASGWAYTTLDVLGVAGPDELHAALDEALGLLLDEETSGSTLGGLTSR